MSDSVIKEESVHAEYVCSPIDSRLAGRKAGRRDTRQIQNDGRVAVDGAFGDAEEDLEIAAYLACMEDVLALYERPCCAEEAGAAARRRATAAAREPRARRQTR